MNKKAFTLSELLVTIGIIGVVAALSAPTLSGLMPNKYKSLFIKSYTILENTIDEVLADPELYWVGDAECVGISCTETTGIPGREGIGTNFIGAKKLPKLISNRLNLNSTINCGEDNSCNFVTNDGVKWEFKPTIASGVVKSYTVHIDCLPSGGKSYWENPKKPSKFSLKIEEDGDVLPNDPMGAAYLKNSMDLHQTDADRDAANDIESNYQESEF